MKASLEIVINKLQIALNAQQIELLNSNNRHIGNQITEIFQRIQNLEERSVDTSQTSSPSASCSQSNIKSNNISMHEIVNRFSKRSNLILFKYKEVNQDNDNNMTKKILIRLNIQVNTVSSKRL